MKTANEILLEKREPLGEDAVDQVRGEITDLYHKMLKAAQKLPPGDYANAIVRALNILGDEQNKYGQVSTGKLKVKRRVTARRPGSYGPR